MAEYYHVRISPKRKVVDHDFGIFLSEMMATREGKWDKDGKNGIVAGDYLGFITGPCENALVYIFKVSREGSIKERPWYWANDTPYNEGNGTNSVSERQVIILTNNHSLPKTYEWSDFKAKTGLGGSCISWMPRGTQRVVNKKRLPFKIDDGLRTTTVL
jgi:hypothetical protein